VTGNGSFGPKADIEDVGWRLSAIRYMSPPIPVFRNSS
jgi:hypothetical protein